MLKCARQQRGWQVRNTELGIREQEEATKDVVRGGDGGKGGRNQTVFLSRHHILGASATRIINHSSRGHLCRWLT